jgi:hypothetical protein
VVGLDHVEGRAFISHAAEDESIARRLKAELETRGIETFAYEGDLPFGGQLVQEVERAITRSDYFLVLLSDDARQSVWVGRELGLALHLQRSSHGQHPLVVGVQTEQPCNSTMFDVLDYDSGAPADVSKYDFSGVRCFNYRSGDASSETEDFATFLLPRVTFVNGGTEAEDALLYDSFSVYEQCFPDAAERDDPEDIEEWLALARHGVLTGSRWREVYGVLSVAGRAIGMAFFTSHLQRRWIFANYFAVSRGWRQLRRAEAFLESVADRLREIQPGLRGVLFEIEPINVASLEHWQEASITSLPHDERKRLLDNLRNVRRLAWYESYGARALLGADGQPLPYWQPAMEDPLSSANERRLVVMVKTFGDVPLQGPDYEEILSFLYDDLYGDAYGEGSMEIAGYRPYVETVKQRMLDGQQAGIHVGSLRLSRGVSRALSRAKRDGLFEHLHL